MDEAILLVTNKGKTIFRINPDGGLFAIVNDELQQIHAYSDIAIAFAEAMKVMNEIHLDEKAIRIKTEQSIIKDMMYGVTISSLEHAEEQVVKSFLKEYSLDNNIDIS